MKAIPIFLFALLLSGALNVTCQETPGNKNSNELKIEVEGGDQGFRDEAIIHFREGATTGYDVAYDAIKWYSPDPEATMIWTVASDGTNLAVNKLPLEDLHNNLNSIPLQFVCGYGGGEYLLTFSELETFDANVEIWLEDLLHGDNWINITSEETVYLFNGLPDEPADRFMIHIFDPAAVLHTDGVNKKLPSVNIYAAGNKIYLTGPASTEITDIKVFDILGQEVNYKEISSAGTLNILQINGQTGYYVVRAVTKDRICTEKVLIVH